jgi:hypothetical protein
MKEECAILSQLDNTDKAEENEDYMQRSMF